MIIHAHALPRASIRLEPIHAPLFYQYEMLQPETWGPMDDMMPCWTPNADGIQLGLQWTSQQRRELLSYTPFKTYEIVQGIRKSVWVGVERIGYLLPEGFLPLRITYRTATDTHRVVMPGNVGYLYNYLMKLPQSVCAGVAPQLQFALDIDPSSSRHGTPSKNYRAVQQLIPHIINSGPHLSWDIRSQADAFDEVRGMSQALDMLGNARYRGEENVMDWVYTHIVVEPPVRDTTAITFPVGPIPMSVLQSWYGPGIIDTTVPPPLVCPPHAWPIPEDTLQEILNLQSTDLWVSFPMSGGRIDPNPLTCFEQNRFGAYVPLHKTHDLTLVRGFLLHLWAKTQPSERTDGIAMLHLTCNEEVKICFGDHQNPERHMTFYADLNDVTNAWRGVAQTPLFSQRR